MKLTKEDAIKYHREMWADMLKDLGENPSFSQREEYKKEWCEKHFPNEVIQCCCFLCEYDDEEADYDKPRTKCPIDWGKKIFCGCVHNDITWHSSPISAILALPERVFI